MKVTANTTLKYCKTNNIRLTELRQAILLILTESKNPVSAYEILALLKQKHQSANVMTVYRVIDFLINNKLVHRIESLNAFSICSYLNTEHQSQWLICEKCNKTIEHVNNEFKQSMNNICSETGFYITQPTIELKGVCAKCTAKSDNLSI